MAFDALATDLVLGLKHFFAKVPTEQVTGCLQSGVLFTGGAVQIQGIQDFMQNQLQAEVVLSDSPQYDVIEGLAQFIGRKKK